MIIYNNENEPSEEVVKRLVQLSVQDKSKLNVYFDYYKNKQLIDTRVLSDKSKPNNKIKINYCRKLCDFMTSYLVGVPVKFENADKEILDILNYTDFNAVLNDCVLDMNICGYGIGILYIDEDSKVRFARVNPLDTIIVIDNDIENNIRFAITVYEKTDIISNRVSYTITLYKDDEIITYSMNDGEQVLKIEKRVTNYFNAIPFCLFMNKDMISSMDSIITMQNALNKLASDEVNEFEGMVDSFLVLPGYAGTNENDITNMKQNRVLLTSDNDSKPYWLVKTDTGSHTKDMKEFFIEQIHDVGRLPDMKETNFGTSGVALRYKLIDTEILASKQELAVTKGIQAMLFLMFKYLELVDEKSSEYTDIKLVFTRNFIMENNDKTSSNDNSNDEE